MSRKIIPAGSRFARLVVIAGAAPYIEKNGWASLRSLCRCDCGTEIVVRDVSLRFGQTRSCGCLQVEITRARETKHGGSRTREYNIWCGIISRCTNMKEAAWKNYGGRGISMCERWRHSFATFLADMGPCPKGLTLERVNNNGNYEPSNCKWATRAEQNSNKRCNVIVTVRDMTGTLKAVAAHFKVPYKRTANRWRDGRWSLEEVFFAPKYTLRKRRKLPT